MASVVLCNLFMTYTWPLPRDAEIVALHDIITLTVLVLHKYPFTRWHLNYACAHLDASAVGLLSQLIEPSRYCIRVAYQFKRHDTVELLESMMS